MKTRRLFLAAVVLLAFGIWLLAAYFQGSAGFAAGDAISAFSIKLDVTTTGFPAIFGVPAVGLGSLLLIGSSIATVVLEVREAFSRKRQAGGKPESISSSSEQRPPL
jgi:hypothetical protein